MVDESAQHAGHAGARETDSPSGETHFRVALVSPEFEGLPTIKRHRLVYQARAGRLGSAVPVRYMSIAFHHLYERMRLASTENLLEQLTVHRLEIRAAFEEILF